MARGKDENAPKKKKRGQGEGGIYQRKDGTWEARVTVGYGADGKQIRKSFYGKRRKDVQDKMDIVKAELAQGAYVEPSKMTVAQWMDEWLSVYRKNSKKNTYDRYTGAIEGYVKPMLGTCKLKDLRKDMVQGFVNALIDKGLAGRTVKCYYAVLDMALRQAYKDEIITKDLVKNITLPPIENKERKVLTPKEQDIFIEAAKGSTNGDIYILILGTGLRLGEALALTWDDVDFEKGRLRINKTTVYTKGAGGEHFKLSTGTPKTKASNRIIPLYPDVIKLLKNIKAEQAKRRLESGGEYTNNNLVFANRDGNPYISRNVQKRFQELIKEAGLEYMTIHGLRHTFATRGLEKGIELRVMQDLLGHSSIKMTGDLYTHVLEDNKKESIMKLTGLLNF